MSYTSEQLALLQSTRTALKLAGLSTGDLSNIPSSPPRESSPGSDNDLPLSYVPPSASALSIEDIRDGKGRITRERSIQSVIRHPLGAIVEYPQTGIRDGLAVGHIFPIDIMDEFVNPKDNIQFSLGGKRGIHYSVKCYLLLDEHDQPVTCIQTKVSCCSIKKCDFAGTMSVPSPKPTTHEAAMEAQQEVFMKTLGFFCALREQGCYNISDDYHSADSDPLDLLFSIQSSFNHRVKKNCSGRLVLDCDKFNRLFIRCEFYNAKVRGHLILRNLEGYDILYLRALMDNKHIRIREYEEAALRGGYGPLVPCQVTSTCRELKDLCPNWHRNRSGVLQRGRLVNMENCNARFEVYEPHDLKSCPFILLVCLNPHSHPNPNRTKTPESINRIFTSLLDQLEWRLADATPRRLSLDHGFLGSLRSLLSWKEIRDPTLGELHPSLANLDHVARLINKQRSKCYPSGTGWEGAKLLLSEHMLLPSENRYIRCVETYSNPIDGEFQIVICMFKAMSHILLQSKRPSIDTSFKRLHNWQEFEIEVWLSESKRSIVVARAFTTSQSAEAHSYLFKRIFGIVEEDTGQPIQFRHIHGSGIDTFTADGHRGQALGLGLFCQDVCKKMTGYCTVDKERLLSSLTPTEHLARFYRYCFAHYTRHVTNLQGQISEEVHAAMMSLASSELIPDFAGTLQLIRNGGKKAADWLKDKEASNGMALAAVYQPASKIPLDIWRAAPPTSNGNEQAHRNINRDGVKLTLLAGIMRGLQYDSRALIALNIFTTEGIYSRDRVYTHFARESRAIRKKGSLQHKLVNIRDSKKSLLYAKTFKSQTDVQKKATALQHALQSGAVNVKTLQKKLRSSFATHEKNYQKLHKSHSMFDSDSAELVDPSTLFNSTILESPSLNHTNATGDTTRKTILTQQTSIPPQPASRDLLSLPSLGTTTAVHEYQTNIYLSQPVPGSSFQIPTYPSSLGYSFPPSSYDLFLRNNYSGAGQWEDAAQNPFAQSPDYPFFHWN